VNNVLILIAALGLTACCSSHKVKNSSGAEEVSVAETIYGYKTNSQRLLVKVKSHGCTQSKHFSLRKVDSTSYELVRNKPDYCKRMPMVVQIEMAAPVNDVALTNPVAAEDSLKKQRK
jgi:hypothetical protein